MPETPAASLWNSDIMKHREKICELDDGPGQSGGTATMKKTEAKETAVMDAPQEIVLNTSPNHNLDASHTSRWSTSPMNVFDVKHTPRAPRNWKAKAAGTHRASLPLEKTPKPPSVPHNRLNELDDEIYGITDCPSTPARAVVEICERNLRPARTDKEDIELAHELALQAKDQEVKLGRERVRKLEEKYRRKKRAYETKIQEAESERDRIGYQHSEALQEKELQLRQAIAEIDKLKEQHTEAIEEKQKELQHARAKIHQMREELEARNTNEQGYELANLQDEIVALKNRLALAEKPDNEWIKYLPTTPNFYEAAPHLHPDVMSFDRGAKLKEIETRPSRKQTFGKRLSNVRKERGLYPHYLPGKQLMKEPSPARTAVAVVVSSDGEKSAEAEEQDSGDLDERREESLSDIHKAMRVFDDMMAVPKNPIPCLVDNQLAWRDGTRVCTSGYVMWGLEADCNDI